MSEATGPRDNQQQQQEQRNRAEAGSSSSNANAKICTQCNQPSPCECARKRHANHLMPRVGEGLYVCGAGAVTNPKVLAFQGITHVLNMAVELDIIDFPEGVIVRHASLRDSETQELLPLLPELTDHVRRVVNGGGRIVVNCVAGISRSVSVCLAYKVKHEAMSLREAYEQVLQVRPVAAPNPSFWKDLIAWEEQERGSSSVVLMPYICGTVPELPSYQDFARMRCRVGWMREMILMWLFHLLIFILQCVGILLA